jgi:cytochrome c peroxidase
MITAMRRMIFLTGALAAASARGVRAEDPKPYPLPAPLGIETDSMIIPADNPMSAEKVELGKLLYFDKRLSKDGTVSCATCHDPKRGYTDQSPVSSGIKGQKGARSSPTVLNAAYNYLQFWDGRAKTLEEQAKGPIQNPVEMGNTHEAAVKTLAGIPGYAPYFKKAFGTDAVTIDRVAQAIASFERTVVSGNFAWDRYVKNEDKTALTPAQQRGLAVFEGKGRCTLCHVGFTFSDSQFHNLGVGMSAAKPDLGRYEVTKKESDKGAFKTPMLRDLLRTAPYMHDGSRKTLADVVDLYDKGGEPNKWLDPKIQPLHLTSDEKKDLVAFLGSLEGDWVAVAEPTLPK